MTLKESLLIAALFAFAGFCLYASTHSGNNWEAFAKSHDCRPAQITTYSTGKIAWKCNDGVTYWR
ncbi:hypothetical protein [Pseudomonas fluorescens]|uniref:hypothetical protein n=1 Tax=Pseudomonas fluorescens TaxID=294 RepID=UPI001CA79FD5|nr:hypothetical protein [Pseudomonas fluorescens]MBY8934252.1 hypothetical protein [Pseudomonas fluorescens]